MKKSVKWISRILLVLVLIVAAGAEWIYHTESGLQWGLQYSQQFWPDELKIDGVSGSLSQKVKVAGFIWETDSVLVQASEIQLECDWISFWRKQMQCLKINADSLQITTRETPVTSIGNNDESTDESTDESVLLQPLAEYLPDIALPFAIDLAELNLAKLIIASDSQNERTETTRFTAIHLSKLKSVSLVSKLSPRQFSNNQYEYAFDSLKFDFLEYRWQANGEFTPLQGWPYRISLAVSGKDAVLNLDSKGTLALDSEFELTSDAPLKSLTRGKWDWRRGFNVSQADSTIEKHQLDIAEQTVTFTQGQLQSTLNWPKATVDFNGQLEWGALSPLNIKGQLKSPDVASWRNLSQLQMALTNEMTAQQFQQLTQLAGTLDPQTAQSSANVTLSLAIDARLQQSILDLKATTPIVETEGLSHPADGGPTIGLNLHGKLQEYALTDVDFSGKLSANDLQPLTGLQAKGTQLSWQLSDKNDRYALTTQGNIESVSERGFLLSGLSWDVSLTNSWQAKITATQFEHYEQSSPSDKNNSTSLVALAKNISINVKGTPDSHQIYGNFKVNNNDNIAFSLQGKTISGDGFAALANGWQVNQLVLKIPNEIGRNQSNLMVKAKEIVFSPQQQKVKQLCIEQTGQVCAHVKLTGEQWSGDFHFKDFALDTITQVLQRLGVTSSVQFSGGVSGDAQLKGDFHQLHFMQVNLNLPLLKVNIDDWQGTVNQVNIKSDKQAGYRLTADWHNQQLQLPSSSWPLIISSESGEFNVEIADNYDIKAQLSNQQISVARRRQNTPAENLSDAPLTWTIPSFEITGQVLHDQSSEPAPDDTRHENSELQPARLQVTTDLQLPGDDFIRGTIESAWPFSNDTPLSGKIELNIAQSDWLKRWQPQVDQFEYVWRHQLSLSGTLQHPSLNGQGDIAITRLVVDELGLELQQSEIHLTNKDQSLLLTGKLTNPKGELRIDGNAQLMPQLSASLSLTGNGITLLGTDENQVVISPKLNANYENNLLEVKGDISFDQAHITLSGLPQQAISNSPDQIILNQPKVHDENLQYKVDLNMQAKNGVSIKGFGLSSELVGNLHASAQSDKTLKLYGDLQLKNGEFKAYQQELKIDEGQLLFLGPAENPGIQFKATRKIDEITVGVIADGSLVKPTLTLFSEPAMAEENILALLLTGRSLESLSQSEGNALANAAISLGVSQANKLAEKIGSVLGIKNIQITSTTKAESTRVDIGTQISDKLSIGYGTSIDSSNQLNAGWIVEYRLSPSISFEAISGEEISASITFKKQFNENDSSLNSDKKGELKAQQEK